MKLRGVSKYQWDERTRINQDRMAETLTQAGIEFSRHHNGKIKLTFEILNALLDNKFYDSQKILKHHHDTARARGAPAELLEKFVDYRVKYLGGFRRSSMPKKDKGVDAREKVSRIMQARRKLNADPVKSKIQKDIRERLEANNVPYRNSATGEVIPNEEVTLALAKDGFIDREWYYSRGLRMVSAEKRHLFDEYMERSGVSFLSVAAFRSRVASMKYKSRKALTKTINCLGIKDDISLALVNQYYPHFRLNVRFKNKIRNRKYADRDEAMKDAIIQTYMHNEGMAEAMKLIDEFYPQNKGVKAMSNQNQCK